MCRKALEDWMKQIYSFQLRRQRSLRLAAVIAIACTVGSAGAFAAETGTNLPWEGPLTTLVTSLTGPVAYAISVVAIVALGATLAFAGGEMGETMKRLLHVGIAVCCVVFAAQVMSSFIGQAAEISLLLPVQAIACHLVIFVARG
jgi:type IV secretory pathway VirB2 component (pilin)